jgi:uncharacterized protein (TIGR03083 family)
MAAPDPLDALRGECELVSEVVLSLDEEGFGRPTRLPAWDVKDLLGHMYRDVDRINVALAEAEPPAATDDSVSYWRSYDPAIDSTDIADRAKQVARSFSSGKELAQAWDAMWRRALDDAAAIDRKRLVVTWGPALTLQEFLKTRVLEITVHGLDLANALERPPWATVPGTTVTTEILTGLLRDRPSHDLGWSDLTFIEKGTGRAALDERDRLILGFAADRFPLLA